VDIFSLFGIFVLLYRDKLGVVNKGIGLLNTKSEDFFPHYIWIQKHEMKNQKHIKDTKKKASTSENYNNAVKLST